MDAFRKEALARGEAALKDVPQVLTSMTSLLEKSLNRSHAEVEAMFAYKDESVRANEDLIKLNTSVMEHIVRANHILRTISAWVRMLIPKVEDGGNFGVEIQYRLVKSMDELIKAVQFSDGAMTYHEKRSGLAEKLLDVTKEEEKRSSDSKTGGDNAGESQTVSKTTTVSSSSSTDDAMYALVACDVKFFNDLKAQLVNARDSLLTVGDFIEKNKEKLLNPRAQGGNYY